VSDVEFRVLGPLEVLSDGRPIPLGGPRQRALLAILLSRANEVVSIDALIDDLWGALPPPTAANTVQFYVSRLRKLLGAERILTQPPGYLICVEPDALDLDSFERLLARGDADSLREALALWRGPALADVAYEPFAQAEIARLEDLRVVALEKRVDADLEAGGHQELVGELEKLVREHPLRERFRSQLMLALYRSGRQAEALSAYQDARACFVQELGLQPSPALQELERAILRQDASLDVETASPALRKRRAILVAPHRIAELDSLLALAEPLARRPARELIVACVLEPGSDLPAATALLTERRDALASRDVETRVVAYTSEGPGKEVAQLATQQDVDLVLTDAPGTLVDGDGPGPALEALLHKAPCDVGVLVGGDGALLGSGPVVVPFGGVEHDWSAVEIAAWLARSLGTSLRLAGTEATGGGRRDASRLLARASLVVQTAVGVVAEPALIAAGAAGVVDAAADAAVVVLGLSDRWRDEGIGEARLEVARRAACPTLIVRRGLRPGGLAPPETMTRFTWTLSESA
jgi:DNA-binding SARP family transcriptional activator